MRCHCPRISFAFRYSGERRTLYGLANTGRRISEETVRGGMISHCFPVRLAFIHSLAHSLPRRALAQVKQKSAAKAAAAGTDEALLYDDDTEDKPAVASKVRWPRFAPSPRADAGGRGRGVANALPR
jgi:hypothetical protein